MNRNNKKFLHISYSFHDITGKGFCPIIPELEFKKYETLEFEVKDVKMLRAGCFIAKGAVVKYNGNVLLTDKFDIEFISEPNKIPDPKSEPNVVALEYKEYPRTMSVAPPIGVALEGSWSGVNPHLNNWTSTMGVAISPMGDAVCPKCQNMILHIEEGCPNCDS